MSNLGMELSLKELGIPFYRANVGDRYVIEAMRERKWQLGGESSGHIICSDLTTTGDGVVAALQVLHAMRDTDTPLNALKKGMQKYPQKMINVRIKQKFNLEDFPAIQQAVGAAESELAERGRVLLRPSGTEPLVRVMVEGEDDQQVATLVKQIAAVIDPLRSMVRYPVRSMGFQGRYLAVLTGCMFSATPLRLRPFSGSGKP